MNRYAMIISDLTVRGVCAWDGITPWTPPPGIDTVLELMPDEVCGPGWIYTSEQTPRFNIPSDN